MAKATRGADATGAAPAVAALPQRRWHALARPPVLVASLLIAIAVVQSSLLIYADLNLQYPFMFPDSYDWIANGLYYAGHAVRYTARPPGLPLIIAALARTGALWLLPLVNQVVLLGVLAACYRLYTGAVTRMVALVAVALLFASSFVQSLALYVLADLYCLLFLALSLLEFARAREAPRRYVLSALYLGISLTFQYAGIALLPAYGLVWLICRRRTPAWRHLALAAATVVAILGPWILYRWVAFDDPMYSGVQHGELVRWHLDSIPFYLFNTVGAVGLVGCALALVGLMVALRHGRDETLLLMLLALAGNIVFWVLLYDWNDRRFVLYWLIPIYYLVARGVRVILSATPIVRRSGWVIVGVILGLALHANLDCGSPLSVDRIVLSPRHHLVARAIARGYGLDIDLSDLHLERVDLGMADSLAISRPLATRYLPVSPPLPADVTEARQRLTARYPNGTPALWFHPGSGESRSWSVLRNRYGNAFLTVLHLAASPSRVPAGEPILVLKPYDSLEIATAEVLWEGTSAVLIVARDERQARPILTEGRMAHRAATHSGPAAPQREEGAVHHIEGQGR